VWYWIGRIGLVELSYTVFFGWWFQELLQFYPHMFAHD
jgi:hypothetical protein